MLKNFLQRLSPTQQKGRAAEDEARLFLEKKGYRFRRANFWTPLGEVDLVMEKGDAVVFVEVRSRAGTAWGRPEESVRPAKQKRFARAALTYVKRERLGNKNLRFDIVALLPAGVTHIENAFTPPPGRYTI
jgi:putative endonuclease